MSSMLPENNDPSGPVPSASARCRPFWAYKRRWIIWGGVVLLLGTVGFYNYITQDHRVKAYLQRQLSGLVGGPVRIGHASFSLARGLVVEDVTINTEAGGMPEGELLKAGKLRLTIHYSGLLKGLLHLEQVVAEDVELTLTEDLDSGKWNVTRLLRKSSLGADSISGAAEMSGMQHIPDIYLNDVRLRYVQKSGTTLRKVGQVQVEAGIHPTGPDAYAFTINTHGDASRSATTILGVIDRKIGEVNGRITELDFDDDVIAMLPADVRSWVDEFGLRGRFSVPRFVYFFDQARDEFEVALAFENVQATVQPRHWLSGRENARLKIMRQAIDLYAMLGMDRPLPSEQLAGESTDDATPVSLLSYLQFRTRTIALELAGLTGQVCFSPRNISLESVRCELQGQAFLLSGEMAGYELGSPAQFQIKTVPGTFLEIPPSRQFMTWLPDDVRNTYLQFKPQGKAALDVQLRREQPQDRFDATVLVELFDGQFQFEDFPYPLRQCTGRLVFSRDPQTDQEILTIQRLRGFGVADGPNRSSFVEVNGTVGPFVKGGPAVHIEVAGNDISSEPAVRHAFPREIAKAMLIFGPPDYGHRLAASSDQQVELTPEETILWPKFFGDFVARINRDAGFKKPVDTHVRLNLKRATGSLKAFPYPMHDLSAVVDIRNDRLTLEQLRLKDGATSLEMSGAVRFTDPAAPDLKIKALYVPIGRDLLDAMPPVERMWVGHYGLGGHVDIIGRVFLSDQATPQKASVDFDLDLNLRNAVLMKDANGPAFTQLNGTAFLEPARLQIKDVVGRRGDGRVRLAGDLNWADGSPDVRLEFRASNLLLDEPLKGILPPSAQEAWDQHKPQGTADVDLVYTLTTPVSSTRGHDGESGEREHLKMTLRPLRLAATSEVFPYRLDDLSGEVRVDGEAVELRDLTGRHGGATISVNGKGRTGQSSDFRLSVHAQNLTPDEQLLAAIPSAVSEMISSVRTQGQFDVTFDKLNIRSAAEPRIATSTRRKASAATPEPVDVDFDCTITTQNGQIDIGVPMDQIKGSSHLTGQVRSDSLVRMDGQIDLDRYLLVGREGFNLTATIHRPMYMQGFELKDIRTRYLGGTLAGAMTALTPEDGPSQYAVDVSVHNADAAKIAGESVTNPPKAAAGGSLMIEGVFGDPGSRRGRGDVLVSGQNIYEVPLMLGLFRMVHFGLPVSEGVREVGISYILAGDRVTFENIELKSPGLRIYGDGYMDFESRKVDLAFDTENTSALKLPFIGPLIRAAQRELLKIRVQGTLEEPKVTAESLPTFRTTLDQVIGDVAGK